MGLPGLTRDEKKDMFIIALTVFRGNISKACEQVMISRQTYHNWIDRDDDFADRVKACADDIRQTVADALEDVVINSGLHGMTQDARWWLSRKAKDRGFGDKVDISGQIDLGHFKGLKYPDDPQDLEDFEKVAAQELGQPV